MAGDPNPSDKFEEEKIGDESNECRHDKMAGTGQRKHP